MSSGGITARQIVDVVAGLPLAGVAAVLLVVRRITRLVRRLAMLALLGAAVLLIVNAGTPR